MMFDGSRNGQRTYRIYELIKLNFTITHHYRKLNGGEGVKLGL